MFDHPDVIDIYDVGRLGDLDYIVLAPLAGQTLEEYARDTALSIPDVLRIGSQVARTLSAAHELGIIHRKLNPTNLFVTPNGHVRVLDFGVAMVLESLDVKRAGIQGRLLSYVAPEQASGTAETEKTDVFAIGAILYELLTGRKAFPGPIPPQVPSRLPTQVRELLRRTMALEPGIRPTAVELAGELEALTAQLRDNVEELPKRSATSKRGANATFSDDIPGSLVEWHERDPLLQTFPSLREQLANLFEAFQRLPPPLKLQFWRERNIATLTYEWAREQEHLQKVYSTVGVGIRRIDGTPTLTGLVTTEDRIIAVQRLSQRITRIGGRIPLLIEYAPTPAPAALLPRGIFTAASPTPPVPSTPLVQSGDEIAGQTLNGFRTPGTLAAIVTAVGQNAPSLLGAAHVLGQVGDIAIHYVGPVAHPIGTVTQSDVRLDAAIAVIEQPWNIDYRCRGANIPPAPPVLPVAGLAVQMHGARSGHLTGFIDQTNTIPAGGVPLGIIPHIRVQFASMQGDSGALLLTGHAQRSAIGPPLADLMAVTYVENLRCGLLGILVAGPPPGAPSTTPPYSYFTPILQILQHFNVEPYVRTI
jgi:hypothetical protein